MATHAIANYIEAEAALRQVGDEVASIMESVRTAIARLQAAGANMGQLTQAVPVGYLTLIEFIEAQANANPGDTVWQNLRARSNKIIGDFTSVQTYINNVNSAVGAVV